MSFLSVITNIWLTFLAICFVLLMLGALLEVSTDKLIGINNIDCFDRNRNKIQNLTCEEEVYGCGIIQKFIGTCKWMMDNKVEEAST